MKKSKKSDIETDYWQGQGRKLIVIPQGVLRSGVMKSGLHSQLYITDLGFYPAAASHYTFRKHGCREMLIIICVHGKGTYETKAGKFEVLPGQFFILQPNEQHKYEADIFEPWSIYWLRIGGSYAENFCKGSLTKKCYKPNYNKFISEICKHFDDIYTTLENGYSINNIAYANMALQHVLALLVYRLQENQKDSMSMPEKAIHFMKENLTSCYSLQELSVMFGYSSSQFSNIFRKETGYSPIDYFIHLKIQHSCILLDLTDKKIYEVAESVGYDDPYYFSRLFKKIMHVSPELYRMTKKG